ncbi:hypothetical protein BDF19DRAFT_182241 [Syncephalis fuscata]|nr:hypothetical protein BDF19DRAFT_182241 [Syncephalis fuscata]
MTRSTLSSASLLGIISPVLIRALQIPHPIIRYGSQIAEIPWVRVHLVQLGQQLWQSICQLCSTIYHHSAPRLAIWTGDCLKYVFHQQTDLIRLVFFKIRGLIWSK